MPVLWHPMIVHFPVALWVASALFDVLQVRRPGDPFWGRAAAWLIGLGLAGAAASIGAGFVDYRAQVNLGVGTAFLRLHLTHSALAYAATAWYAISLLARSGGRSLAPAWRLALAAVGVALISLTGWYGGAMRAVM